MPVPVAVDLGNGTLVYCPMPKAYSKSVTDTLLPTGLIPSLHRRLSALTDPVAKLLVAGSLPAWDAVKEGAPVEALHSFYAHVAESFETYGTKGALQSMAERCYLPALPIPANRDGAEAKQAQEINRELFADVWQYVVKENALTRELLLESFLAKPDDLQVFELDPGQLRAAHKRLFKGLANEHDVMGVG